MAELLDQVGGADKFNTGEVEKSIVNMYGHLQGHIQRGVNDLENETNSLLRQKNPTRPSIVNFVRRSEREQLSQGFPGFARFQLRIKW